MRLILKLIAAPFIVLLTVLVAILLFLFSAASIIMALLGVGLFSGGRHHLSGNCVPAFPLRLAGGGGRCYYGAEQLKPVSAAIHHKLIASGQVGPK